MMNILPNLISLKTTRSSKTKQLETREGAQYESGMGYLPVTESVEIPPPTNNSVVQLDIKDLTKIVFDLETSSRGRNVNVFKNVYLRIALLFIIIVKYTTFESTRPKNHQLMTFFCISDITMMSCVSISRQIYLSSHAFFP